MGKVHGSLTRAGKVRNQTKFIEKSNKIKKKLGRSKFRNKLYKVISNIKKLTHAII